MQSNDTTKVLKECSIKDIFCEKFDGEHAKFQIPIYQRNYAWTLDEVETLIRDIKDSQSQNKPVYYIGTLVTYRREECFEVIDGQQRLTTLYLILKALKVKTNNALTYSARAAASKTLKALADGKECEDGDQSITLGYKNAEKALNKELGEKDENAKASFRDYLLDKVHIIHYQVPQDVDLNHYFEVMNSRGEQLEKHEIVKAQLCQVLSADPAATKTLSEIWEVCSEMNVYVQQKGGKWFNDGKLRDDLSFDTLQMASNDDKNDSTPDSASAQISTQKMSIADLMKGADNDVATQHEEEARDTFQPIIDFPNFLLIVLKLTRITREGAAFDPTGFTLDDKELIREFGNAKPTLDFAKQFTVNLLKARYYLDNYVIHHDNGEDTTNENPWKLQHFKKKGSEDKPEAQESVRDRDRRMEIVHLLSMFEVAFTAKQRKNYLFYCLMHLFEDDDKNEYLTFLRCLADKYFFDVYMCPDKLSGTKQPKANSFDETVLTDGKLNLQLSGAGRTFVESFPDGSAEIPLFVFNYTDYRLWKKYADEIRGEDLKKDSSRRKAFFESLGCSDFGDTNTFNKFYFSRTRKSLEHYYPQAKAGEGKPLSEKEINCFGNFAMIGAATNSSGSDYSPKAKCSHYVDSKTDPVSISSLKFRVMLQICNDHSKDESLQRPEGLEWNADDMREHQQKMLDIVMQPLTSKA